MTEIKPKNLKSKPKANPSKLQNDVANSKLIRDQQIIENDFIHLAESDDLSVATLPNSNISVPLSFWLQYKSELKQHRSNYRVAVQIAADEEVADLGNDLAELDMIVLPFVAYTDGRGYSQAYLLRTRYHFSGELRAVGDVHFDQLDFLARAGFDAFELPDGDDHQSALSAFNEFSQVYQPSADNKPLIFSRRRTNH